MYVLLQDIIAAGAGAFGTIVVAVLGIWAAKRAGIGVTQEKLVKNLQDLVKSQEAKIKFLEESDQHKTQQINNLIQEVEELKALTVHQALLIERLSTKPVARIKKNLAE